MSHYSQGADKQDHRAWCNTFTGTTVYGRNYAVSHSVCCDNTYESEIDDLLAEQGAAGGTRNCPACMVGMATELYQYGGGRDHI